MGISSVQNGLLELSTAKDLFVKPLAVRHSETARTLAIAATFTAEPIEEVLDYWMQKLNFSSTITFAPYNQIFQQLLDPTSLLSSNQHSVNIILLRLEDWQRYETNTNEEATESRIERYISELAQALRARVEHSTTSYLVCICPASPAITSDPHQHAFFTRMEEQLMAGVAGISGIYMVGSEETMTSYPVSPFYDAYGDRVGHMPYTSLFFSALGTLIARKIHAIYAAPYKVIAIDCDQTLWRGICGEDGVDGVVIDMAHKQLQEFLVAQQKAGMLLCLCSKNNEQDVFEVFARHPEMPLKLKHVVAWRINWSPKSQNLRSLAEELQLGLESFIFIDDSLLECAEVQTNNPEVLTFPLPHNLEHLPRQLQHFWAFDRLEITAEDEKRTLLYKQQIQRQALQKESLTLENFLSNLELNIQILRLRNAQLSRVAQLTQRTNQFNCTTIRRTESEIQQFCSMTQEHAGECLTVEVSDRFGDYGLVGVILFTIGLQEIVVDTFLLSCRALGRSVEHQMLARLGEIAREQGVQYVRVPFITTAKNVPAREFLESIETVSKQSNYDEWNFIFSVEALRQLTYTPTNRQDEQNDAFVILQGTLVERAVPSAHQKKDNVFLLDIATRLYDAEQVLQVITAQRHSVDGRESFSAPRTETEERLSEIWAEVLKLDRVSIHDNFFALGGNSLLAVKVSSRLYATMRIDVPLQYLFEAPTVAQMAEIIEQLKTEQGESESIARITLAVHTDNEGAVQSQFQFPVSINQQGLWFLNQLDPHDVSYNLSAFLHLSVPLDIALLRESMQQLIQRQAILRTTFEMVNEQPVQRVAASINVPLVTVDVQHLASFEQETKIQQLATEDVRRPFDLIKGPLLRNLLLKLGPEEYILVTTIHHIVSDGWSMGVFFRELATIYADLSSGRKISLPSLPIQYNDFAYRQQEQAQSEKFAEHLAYWKQHLKDVPTLLELPTDRPRTATVTSKGATHTILLSQKLRIALEALEKQAGVSLYTLLVATFQTLLHRYTGQNDIAIGTVSAGRTRVEFEELIGFFVNTLVLRTDLTGNPSFCELLERVRKTIIEAYNHQEIPFELLVKELQPSRAVGFNPFFQVMLSMHSPMPALLPGWDIMKMNVDTGAAKFDLTLDIEERPEGLAASFEYRTDLFDSSTIDRFANHFQMLLEAVVTDPNQPIEALPLLPESERHQVLVEWNATETAYPQEWCLHQFIEAQVEHTPDAVAVVFEKTSLTYRELDCKANQLAHYLQQQGVKPDMLVGVCMERSSEMVISLLAILKAGGAYVPLDPTYPQERLAFMLEDAQMPILLTQEQFKTLLVPQPTLVISVDKGWDVVGEQSTERPISEVQPHHLAYMIYTSGSTGKPKGALNTHLGICNRLLWMQDAYKLQAGEGVMQKTPFSFDVSVWEFFWPLMVGARLVVARPDGHRDNAYLIQLIQEQQITTMHFVPSMLRIFLEEQYVERCKNLKRVICSGEALSFELQQRFFELLDAELHNLYGPTEAAVDVTYWACERMGKRLLVPIGKPIANIDLYILDAYLQPVPIGVPGELYIGGTGVGRGYFNRPELTAERFVCHPFKQQADARLYKTGDLVRYLSDGNIEYLGRLDHQVKIHGVRIELGEIEAVLDQHPAVREVVVVAHKSVTDDTKLVAYISLHKEQSVMVNTLHDYVKAQLPLYMVPANFVLLSELPLLPNGKVNRHALPKPDENITMTEGTAIAPRTMVEHQLLRLWEELLDVHTISVRDNFFYLGGHSLLATRLFGRIQQTFGKKLNLATFFARPTIEQLAQTLSLQDDKNARSSLVAVQTDGVKQPFFYLHGAYRGDGFYCFPLARHLGADQPFYALESYCFDELQLPPTVEQIAATHIELIRAIQPTGPYQLGGFCNGGLIAYEMARQLAEQGQEVDTLVLIDPSTIGHNKRARWFIEHLSDLIRRKPEHQVDIYLWARHIYHYMQHVYRYLSLSHYRALGVELASEHEKQNEDTLLQWNALYELGQSQKGKDSVLTGRNVNSHKGSFLRSLRSTLGNLFPVSLHPSTHTLRQDWEGLFFWVIASYKPGSYSGKSSFLFAQTTSESSRKRWLKVAKAKDKEVEAYTIAGTHETCKTDYLPDLAAQLQLCINSVQTAIQE